MENSIKVTIYDNEGNCLLNEYVNSPFVGLQSGETFWFGTEGKRTWAKVFKITYGVDTDLKCFVIDIVVELTEKKVTKSAFPETTFIDHGEKSIKGESGGTWSINKSDIIVTVGRPRTGEVTRIALQVNSAEGPIVKSFENIKCGEFLEVTTKSRKIICTLISASSTTPEHSIVRVTENRFN